MSRTCEILAKQEHLNYERLLVELDHGGVQRFETTPLEIPPISATTAIVTERVAGMADLASPDIATESHINGRSAS